MVKDLNPGPDSTRFISVTGVGNTVYLSDSSPKLWKSDGTAARTVVVAESLACYALTAYNGALHFIEGGRFAREGRALGRSDGTAAGTTIVKQFVKGDESFVQGVYFLENVNGTLYYGGGRRG
jgi:ELWxxDGT repeat protein